MAQKGNDGLRQNLSLSERVIRALSCWIPRVHERRIRATHRHTGRGPSVDTSAQSKPAPPREAAAGASEVWPAAAETMDGGGFFAFLDDVIVGKHEVLMREMNRESLAEELEEGPQKAMANPLRPASARTPSSAARSLKDYELIAYLGSGSFAEVTLARRRATQEHYALKKISKSKVEEEGCVERTFTERQLLASLHHPFLVDLHKAFQSPSHLYLLLEFAQGGDFYNFLETKPWVRDMQRRLIRQMHRWNRRGEGCALVSLSSSYHPLSGRQTVCSEDDVMCRTAQQDMRSCEASSAGLLSFSRNAQQWEMSGGSILSDSTMPSNSDVSFYTARPPPLLTPNETHMPIRLIAFYAVEIALVLEYIHKQGFVYRDLKPENILMKRAGHVMLTDFGVAKFRGPGMQRKKERQNSFTGTPQYMSPEMHLGDPHDPRTDWWSFGCILFEMANGRRPFEGENQFAVIRSIVEEDVEVRPSDFMLTGLEIETRVSQLHRQYFECCHYIRQLQGLQSKQRASPRRGENNNTMNDTGLTNAPREEVCEDLVEFSTISELKPTPNTPLKFRDVADVCPNGNSAKREREDSLLVGSMSVTPPAAVRAAATGGSGISSGRGGGGEKETATVSSGYGGTNEFSVEEAQRPMTLEERDQYVQHAMEELNEACELLQDLIHALLERNKEQRISGTSVLEHTFFKCSYVASQMYHRFQTEEDRAAKHLGCGTGAGSLGSSIRRLVEESPSITISGSRGIRHVSPRSENKTERNADGDHLEQSHTDSECPESREGVQFDVKLFLSLAHITRPEAWRRLFLNGNIKPLYVPCLLASDDLRYFPSAITATGDSVIEQQRFLRRMGHRRLPSTECVSALHSGRFHLTAAGRGDEDEDELPALADVTATSPRSDRNYSTPLMDAMTSKAGTASGEATEDLVSLRTPVRGALRTHFPPDAEEVKEEGSDGAMCVHTGICNCVLEENDHAHRYGQIDVDTEILKDNSRNSGYGYNANKECSPGGEKDRCTDPLGELAAPHMEMGRVCQKISRALRKTAKESSLSPGKHSAQLSSRDDRESGDHNDGTPSAREALECRYDSDGNSSFFSPSVESEDDEYVGSVAAQLSAYEAGEMPTATLLGVAYDVDDDVPRRAERKLTPAPPLLAQEAQPKSPFASPADSAIPGTCAPLRRGLADSRAVSPRGPFCSPIRSASPPGARRDSLPVAVRPPGAPGARGPLPGRQGASAASGTAQHYVGFSYDRLSGHAFLLGGEE